MKEKHWVYTIFIIELTWLVTQPLSSQLDQPRSASLSWVRLTGAESCISTQKLARRVEAVLGQRVFISASDAELSIEVLVEPISERTGWRALLTISEPSGKILGVRRLETPQSNCHALNDQLVLAIALAIDPEKAFVQLPDQLSPGRDDTTDPAEALLAELEAEQVGDAKSITTVEDKNRNAKTAPPPGDASKQKKERHHNAFRFRIHAGTAIGLGLQPSPGLGLILLGSFESPFFWPIEINGLYFFENDTEPKQGGVGHLQIVQATLAVCPLAFDMKVGNLRACAGGQSGVIIGKATNPTVRLYDDELKLYSLFGVEAYARLYIRLWDPFQLTLGTAASVPIPEREYKVRTRDPDDSDLSLFTTSPVVGRFELGLGVGF